MQLVCSEIPVRVGSFGVVVTEETVAVPKKVHDLLTANGITKGEDVYHVLVRPGAARVIERHLGWSSDERTAAVAELAAVLPESLRVIPPYVARGGALP